MHVSSIKKKWSKKSETLSLFLFGNSVHLLTWVNNKLALFCTLIPIVIFVLFYFFNIFFLNVYSIFFYSCSIDHLECHIFAVQTNSHQPGSPATSVAHIFSCPISQLYENATHCGIVGQYFRFNHLLRNIK